MAVCVHVNLNKSQFPMPLVILHHQLQPGPELRLTHFCRLCLGVATRTEFTIEQLLVELANGTKVLFWAGLAVSTVAAGVPGHSSVKNWAKWKQRQQQRRGQKDAESRQDRTMDNDAEDIPDGKLCVVCFLLSVVVIVFVVWGVHKELSVGLILAAQLQSLALFEFMTCDFTIFSEHDATA